MDFKATTHSEGVLSRPLRRPLLKRCRGGWFREADPRAELGPWVFMTPTAGARRTPGDHHGGHDPTAADWEAEA